MTLIYSEVLKSFSLDRLRIDTLGLKESFRIVYNCLRVIGLATKDIEIGCVGLVREMGGNQRRLYELGHGISSDPFVFAKMDDLGFTKAFHSNTLTEFRNEVPYLQSVSDGLWITII